MAKNLIIENSKNIFKIISICSAILFLIPCAIAEDILFSDLGMTSEFNRGYHGTSPMGTFYSTSNDYPLEVTVTAHWIIPYRLQVFLNDEQIDSGKISGNVNFSATFKKESVKIGKNTIYIMANPWGGYPFGRNGNLIIYGNSKISSPDIFLPPPIPTPIPTPISTPTPTYNWERGSSSGASPSPTLIQTLSPTTIQTPSPTPTPTPPPKDEYNAIIWFVFVIGFIIYVISKTNIPAKPEDYSITKNDIVFKNVINFLNSDEVYFRYGKNKVEKDYQQDLDHKLALLKERFNYNFLYEASEGKHRIDFLIEGIVGIEMKVHRGGTQVEKELFFQITKYGRLYPKMIGLVLNDSDIDTQELKSEIEQRLQDQNVLDIKDYEIIVKTIRDRYKNSNY